MPLPNAPPPYGQSILHSPTGRREDGREPSVHEVRQKAMDMGRGKSRRIQKFHPLSLKTNLGLKVA